jgi:hypothetical protein
MSCSISVVLPLPDHPAKPNIFMTALYQRVIPGRI